LGALPRFDDTSQARVVRMVALAVPTLIIKVLLVRAGDLLEA
jgi:hypothetical protein